MMDVMHRLSICTKVPPTDLSFCVLLQRGMRMKRPGRHLHLFPPSLPSSVSLQSRPAVIRLMEMNNIFAAQDCGAEGLSPVYRKGSGRAQRAVASPLVQHSPVLYFSLLRLFHTLSPSHCLTGQCYAASLPPLSAHS